MPEALSLQPSSSPSEVQAIAKAAGRAAAAYAAVSGPDRARFLDRIAERLEELGDELLQTAHRETSLPLPRLQGERGRTCGQLRTFAELIRSETWRDVRIDPSDRDRKPLPKPDLRRTQVPLGPVAVFGASNFPLAFSVPGGDTASALAAGCPVVVKAHPAHPETSRLAADAILGAVADCGMPEGTFGVVWGGRETGEALVTDPNIYAVGFTGSLRGGRALFDLAARRERPIPVFAEMGSVNPVFAMPGAIAARAETLAKGYADSLTLGVGQFCTNPGVLIGLDGPEFEALLRAVAEHLQAATPGTMLYEAIHEAYVAGVQARREHPQLVAHCGGEGTAAALFSVSAKEFLAHPTLQEELFGPSAVAVRCQDADEMRAVADALEGQLTATVHFEPDDTEAVRTLLPSLVRMAGRVVANGFPTGVEVSPAMQHGGPYPATTDSRTTSVGTAAILRFVRPVAFQDFPLELLPEELRAE
jgi:NADP-dependent aldehyde dehydrogenase